MQIELSTAIISICLSNMLLISVAWWFHKKQHDALIKALVSIILSHLYDNGYLDLGDMNDIALGKPGKKTKSQEIKLTAVLSNVIPFRPRANNTNAN